MPDPRLRDLFIEMARIPSPSRRERAVADWLRGKCETLGYAVEEDDAGRTFGGDTGNLLVRVPAAGEGPAMLFSAHMDTVEKGDAPVEPRVEGDDIVSAGETIVGADDKCGVSVLLELLHRLKEEAFPHGELRVVFSVGEEIELLGAKATPDAWLEGIGMGVVLDHGYPDEILLGAPTKAAVRVTAHGIGGHGAFPDRRLNAAHALATAVSRLPSGRLDECSTANLGILRAGTAINVIPETAYAEYEVRSHDPVRMDHHLTRTRAILAALESEYAVCLPDLNDPDADPVRRVRMETDVDICYRTYRHDPETAPVRWLRNALTQTGVEAKLVLGQGGSDANILNARGLPTAVVGCGMHGAHGPRERANLPEMHACLATLLAGLKSKA